MVIIAIDPDVTKSGVAILDSNANSLDLHSMTFPELVDIFLSLQTREDIIVCVEAGWINNANWHIRSYDSKAAACAKGNSTGRNHEVGRKMIELCKHWNIPCKEVKPLRKYWQGKDGKITHHELDRIMRAYSVIIPKRTNQEERDAALLALNQTNNLICKR